MKKHLLEVEVEKFDGDYYVKVSEISGLLKYLSAIRVVEYNEQVSEQSKITIVVPEPGSDFYAMNMLGIVKYSNMSEDVKLHNNRVMDYITLERYYEEVFKRNS